MIYPQINDCVFMIDVPFYVCRESYTACPSYWWEDSRHDIHCGRCSSSIGAASWRSEATKWVYPGRLLLEFYGTWKYRSYVSRSYLRLLITFFNNNEDLELVPWKFILSYSYHSNKPATSRQLIAIYSTKILRKKVRERWVLSNVTHSHIDVQNHATQENITNYKNKQKA